MASENDRSLDEPPDALLAAGLRHQQAGAAAEAERIYRALLARQTTPLLDARASNNLAVLLKAAGRLDEAVACYRRAIAALPGMIEPRYGLGLALLALGRPRPAIDALLSALLIDPGNGGTYAVLGNALQGQGHSDTALVLLRRAYALAPERLDIAVNLATSLHRLGHLAEAAGLLRRTIVLHPGQVVAYNNLGLVLRDAGRADAAAWLYRRAIALDPADPGIRNNLANVLKDAGRIPDAMACYEAVLAQHPDHVDALWNRAFLLLLTGDFARGLAEYEARRINPHFRLSRPAGMGRSWTGDALAGRSLLLQAEQGLGDTLQFVRYAALLRRQGAGEIFLQCPAPLVELLGTAPGLSGIVSTDEAPPRVDLEASLLSLPWLCGTRLDTIPAEMPYLAPDPGAVRAWAPRLEGDGRLKVGLVWAGNPAFTRDRQRSPGLAALLPLLDLPGIRFFGLQLGPGREELARLRLPDSFTDLGAEIRGFADTAGIMAGLDLVISSCTAPLHLAGALGRPSWALLAYSPDWRWLLDRQDSPWYPTMRLFRQPKPGDWQGVVETVAEALRDLADQPTS